MFIWIIYAELVLIRILHAELVYLTANLQEIHMDLAWSAGTGKQLQIVHFQMELAGNFLKVTDTKKKKKIKQKKTTE